uniref:Coiled-coil domain-containing protein 80 n=1 Tax=Xiphophorus couchianus TaxID=32473 RepID=A0A3B5MSG7_9TELE
MRAFVCVSLALIYLITWTEADKQTHLKRVPLRRRVKTGRAHSTGGANVQSDEGARVPVRTRASKDRRARGGGLSPRRGDEGTPGARARISRMPNSAASPNLLASFAGKNRVLVISAPHESDGYYRLMMSLLKADVYCELAERHVHQIVMFHQEGEVGGKVRRITAEGKVLQEPLDTALVPRLMSFLKLEKGKFGMVLLKKTLQVEEKYPYPVRLEAVYEVIDQSPMRKVEKLRQKGFVQKCKAAGVEGQVEDVTQTGKSTLFRLLRRLIFSVRPEKISLTKNKQLITSPSEENRMYVQQRDEYLESVCEMAIRKVSIITIFGSLTNSTMKIDHYQIENDKPMKGLRQEDLVNQELITELRKEFGMTYDEFYMVLTDTDMRVKQSYEVPIAMKAVFDYIDTFSSRIREMEQQKRDGVVCKKEDKPRSLENFLSRWRKIGTFSADERDTDGCSFSLTLCCIYCVYCDVSGLRHIAVLKLVGTELPDMGGVLELYPINGSATVEREGLSATLVKDMRNYFQISPEYFSMLLVGKDGNVKSWYPSPMWSMAIIYDLVDSMQLRRQEMAIQQSLGMRCPEDEYGGYGYHQHGYEHGYQEGYHQGYGY